MVSCVVLSIRVAQVRDLHGLPNLVTLTLEAADPGRSEAQRAMTSPILLAMSAHKMVVSVEILNMIGSGL